MHRVGVDFSGAEDGGGHKIRVASWRAGEEVVAARTDRRGLVRLITESAQRGEPSLWRIDAPGGIPRATIREHGATQDWLATAKWMHSFGSPRAWRTALRSVSRVEPRRQTDLDRHAPLAPMNLRVFKQTWTFVAEILLPLHNAGVSIEPMAPRQSPCVVCEGCPASVLIARGWPSHKYKGGGEPPARVRRTIASALVESGIPLRRALVEEAVADEQGDLLDAFVLLGPEFFGAVSTDGIIEGWIY